MMRKVLKILAVAAGVLLLSGAVLAAVIYARSNTVIRRTYVIDQPALPIPTDSAGLARGRHLVEGVLVCKECHGTDHGGTLVIDAGAFMRLPAPNLTRGQGGIAPQLRDGNGRSPSATAWATTAGHSR